MIFCCDHTNGKAFSVFFLEYLTKKCDYRGDDVNERHSIISCLSFFFQKNEKEKKYSYRDDTLILITEMRKLNYIFS